jgi:O-antigen ligase
MWLKNCCLALFSGQKQLSDRLFWMIFYVCVGLLPPLISVVGRKAFYIPLLVISILVLARFFMREDCRNRMIAQFKFTSPAVILLFALVLLVIVHAVAGVVTDPDRLRILSKPLVILLAVILLAFIWSHRDVISGEFLLKMAFIGVLSGLFITIFKIVVMHTFLGAGYRWEDGGLLAKTMHIHDAINDELKILAVFVFLAVLVVKPVLKRYLVLTGLLVAIMVSSFYAIGYHDKSSIIMTDYSETAQFGIVVAAVVLFLGYLAPRLVNNLAFGFLALVFVSAPWLFQLWYKLVELGGDIIPRSRKFLLRGEIWDGVARKVLEAPVFGFGIDSARYLKNISLANNYLAHNDIHHPHNMVLQLWLDLGMLAVLLVTGLLYMGWKYVNSLTLSQRPPVVAGIAMLAVFTMVTHSLWQTWVMAMLTLFIAQASVIKGAKLSS